MTSTPPIPTERLRAALALPSFDGRAAQRAMEPRRRGARPSGAEGRPPRPAAALAYLYEAYGRLRLPLTVRRQDLPEHRGQVSLPGGRPVEGESLWATALREAEEEVGLRVDSYEALGVLAPVDIPVTHTRLLVHVALGEAPGRLEPCPREVERIVVVGLDDLADPRCRRVRPMEIQGEAVDVPYFAVDGLFLWGATAMALSELVARLDAVSGLPADRVDP